MSNLAQMLWDQDSVLQQIAENEGEITPELEARLAAAEKEIPAKVDRIGFSIVMREKEIEALKVMESSFNARRKSLEKSIERFKAWLAGPVGKLGTDGKVKGAVVTIKDITRDVIVVETDEAVPFDKLNMVVTLKIPYPLYDKMREDNLLLAFATKAVPEANKELLTEDTPGCKKVTVKNVSFLGLKKLEVKPRLEA